MELKSREEVEAYAELHTAQQVQNIEKKIARLAYEPVWVFLGVVVFAFINFWLESESIIFSLLFMAGALAAMSRNSVERNELTRQLHDIKYGKKI